MNDAWYYGYALLTFQSVVSCELPVLNMNSPGGGIVGKSQSALHIFVRFWILNYKFNLCRKKSDQHTKTETFWLLRFNSWQSCILWIILRKEIVSWKVMILIAELSFIPSPSHSNKVFKIVEDTNSIPKCWRRRKSIPESFTRNSVEDLWKDLTNSMESNASQLASD